MTEEVKQEVKRKPRTKEAPSPVETTPIEPTVDTPTVAEEVPAPEEAPPIEAPVESPSAPTVAEEVPPPAPHDLAKFKGSFTTPSGSVVTYL